MTHRGSFLRRVRFWDRNYSNPSSYPKAKPNKNIYVLNMLGTFGGHLGGSGRVGGHFGEVWGGFAGFVWGYVWDVFGRLYWLSRDASRQCWGHLLEVNTYTRPISNLKESYWFVYVRIISYSTVYSIAFWVWAIIRHHGVGDIPGWMEIIPTSFPELPKSARTPGNWQKLSFITRKLHRKKRDNPLPAILIPSRRPLREWSGLILCYHSLTVVLL